jgi:hypothetical protein
MLIDKETTRKSILLKALKIIVWGVELFFVCSHGMLTHVPYDFLVMGPRKLAMWVLENLNYAILSATTNDLVRFYCLAVYQHEICSTISQHWVTLNCILLSARKRRGFLTRSKIYILRARRHRVDCIIRATLYYTEVFRSAWRARALVRSWPCPRIPRQSYELIIFYLFWQMFVRFLAGAGIYLISTTLVPVVGPPSYTQWEAWALSPGVTWEASQAGP